MEGIITIEDAVAYLGEFVPLEDLKVVEIEFSYLVDCDDVGGVMRMFGFVESSGHWDYVGGREISATVFPLPQGRCIAHVDVKDDRVDNGLFTTRVYKQPNYIEFRSSFRLHGNTWIVNHDDTNVRPSFKIDGKRMRMTIGGGGTSKSEIFEDLDGKELKRISHFKANGDFLYSNTWLRNQMQCISGPAVISPRKNRYFLDGEEISYKKWLEKRLL
jgi:hypothetical protein